MNGTNSKYYDYKYRLNKYQTENQQLPPESYAARTPYSTPQQQPGANALYSRSSPKSYDVVYCECPIHGAVQYRESRPRSNSHDPSWDRQVPEESYQTRMYYRRASLPTKSSYGPVPQTNSNPYYRYTAPTYETEAYPNGNEEGT